MPGLFWSQTASGAYAEVIQCIVGGLDVLGDMLWKMTIHALNKDKEGQTTNLVNRKTDSEEENRHLSTTKMDF